MRADNLKSIHNNILKIASNDRADISLRFFKTGKGQYGEGDKFLGVSIPQIRKLSKLYKNISLTECEQLLSSKYHEERSLALIILITKYQESQKLDKKDGFKIRREIFDLYFKNLKYINNWDLVDVSCRDIVGEFIKEKHALNTKNCVGVRFLSSLASDKYIFAKNEKEKLWEKRIAIVSCYAFMMKSANDNPKDNLSDKFSSEIIFHISKKVLTEKDKLNSHDLIQKAVGWMLREYGKRINQNKLKHFLNDNFDIIKDRRTLLRYAIERFSLAERKAWLEK